ncbi:hypothetical protein ZWY2020_047141 [Hordeum vulgare]|nr:hypothetical protein ZWY2020_047141 [Hordeum vulgare]
MPMLHACAPLAAPPPPLVLLLLPFRPTTLASAPTSSSLAPLHPSPVLDSDQIEADPDASLTLLPGLPVLRVGCRLAAALPVRWLDFLCAAASSEVPGGPGRRRCSGRY